MFAKSKKPVQLPHELELEHDQVCGQCHRAGNHAPWCPQKNRNPPPREADDAAD